jgi:hypothetical protein
MAAQVSADLQGLRKRAAGQVQVGRGEQRVTPGEEATMIGRARRCARCTWRTSGPGDVPVVPAWWENIWGMSHHNDIRGQLEYPSFLILNIPTIRIFVALYGAYLWVFVTPHFIDVCNACGWAVRRKRASWLSVYIGEVIG